MSRRDDDWIKFRLHTWKVEEVKKKKKKERKKKEKEENKPDWKSQKKQKKKEQRKKKKEEKAEMNKTHEKCLSTSPFPEDLETSRQKGAWHQSQNKNEIKKK